MTEEESGETMAGVDHTHPITDEPFGEPYRRGAVPPADGESADQAEETDADAEAPEIRPDGGEPKPIEEDRDERAGPTMADVDHAGADAGVSHSFERGRVREGETE